MGVVGGVFDMLTKGGLGIAALAIGALVYIFRRNEIKDTRFTDFLRGEIAELKKQVATERDNTARVQAAKDSQQDRIITLAEQVRAAQLVVEQRAKKRGDARDPESGR